MHERRSISVSYLVQIMDPKMDSGVTIPEVDAVVERFDPLLNSQPEEILWIMDELLCFEVSSHSLVSIDESYLTCSRWYGMTAIHSPRHSSHLST